ncbi:MAG: hypothetical protein ABI047_18060 [Jatrophihabitantaceae bacterium]
MGEVALETEVLAQCRAVVAATAVQDDKHRQIAWRAGRVGDRPAAPRAQAVLGDEAAADDCAGLDVGQLAV